MRIGLGVGTGLTEGDGLGLGLGLILGLGEGEGVGVLTGCGISVLGHAAFFITTKVFNSIDDFLNWFVSCEVKTVV
jgi:hypothetical protein